MVNSVKSEHTAARLPVAVVVASLGGPTLHETIETLNTGGLGPARIFACIPADVHPPSFLEKFDNVRVVRVEGRGQVLQRAEGFRIAHSEAWPYILQLDDDLTLLSAELDHLLRELQELGSMAALAPVLVSRADGTPHIRLRSGLRGVLDSAVAVVLHGAPWGVQRMGRIAPSGKNYGVDPTRMKVDRMQVDWLPGGCVLHSAANLVVSNYFPFEGKAFGEDVIHSHLLRRHGVALWVTRGASCHLDHQPAAGTLRTRLERLRAIHHVARFGGATRTRRLMLMIDEIGRTIASVLVRDVLRVGLK